MDLCSIVLCDLRFILINFLIICLCKSISIIFSFNIFFLSFGFSSYWCIGFRLFRNCRPAIIYEYREWVTLSTMFVALFLKKQLPRCRLAPSKAMESLRLSRFTVLDRLRFEDCYLFKGGRRVEVSPFIVNQWIIAKFDNLQGKSRENRENNLFSISKPKFECNWIID